jgi:hypothetical protein
MSIESETLVDILTVVEGGGVGANNFGGIS